MKSTHSLTRPTIPDAPVHRIKPEPSSTICIPLVCDSPHSGTNYPDDFGFSVPLRELRRSEDTHVEKLWASVPRYGGELISASFPRSYIDPNRAIDDIDQTMLSGPWPTNCAPSKRCIELGNGLVFSKTTQLGAIYQRKLSVAEIQSRIDRYWRPYREALDDAMQSAARNYGARWHLNLHSMPSNAYQRLGIATDRRLADIVLGDVNGMSCKAEFTQIVAKQFADLGYSVAINDPYAGQDLLRMYGQPAQRLQSLQIEINRALYLNEDTREPTPRFSELQADIGQVLKGIATYIQTVLQTTTT